MSFSIYIMRHAKSDWSTMSSDFDRPINKRGENNAVRIGRWMHEQGILPEMVICSSANRAKQTWQLVNQELGGIYTENLVLTRDLYLADAEFLLDKIKLYQHGVNSLLLIAHNPGLDILVNHLSNNQLNTDKNGKLMTTAALAIFEYKDTDLFQPNHMQIIRPKELD